MDNKEQVRTWNDLDYSINQLHSIKSGRSSDNHFGNIDDLDPNKYDCDQMTMISLGRGTDPEYANIDDLDPEIYNAEQMEYNANCRWEYNNPKWLGIYKP